MALDTSELALADSQGHTTITPDPEGTIITGDVNVAVTTNTVEGYTLSIYTQDNSKAMSHSNSTVDAKINSIDTVSGYDANSGASSLSNNTWGFRRYQAGAYGNWFAVGENEGNGTIIDSPSEEDSDYCENLSYPLNQTGCDSSTYNTYQIGFGAKLTSSLPAGTYTNNVVFSAVAKSEGTKYTMNFNANGGTNTMGSRTVLSGSNIVMPKIGFVKEGMSIKGWAMVENATTDTTPIFLAGQTVAINDLISAATNAGQSVASSNSFTVYAVWEEKTDGNMQSFNCASLASGATAKLKDTRDDTIYTVKKLPDGKCWMIDNLTISATGMVVDSLDNTNTNIPSNDSTKYYLPPRNTRYATANSITNSAVKTASGSVDFSSGNSNQPQIGYKAAGSTDNDAGNPVPENTAYYPYYTATLGFSYYSDGKTSGSSPRDICPKGWRLPWTSDAGTTRQGNAEFYTLALAYNNDSSVWTNYIAPGSTGSSSPNTSNATVLNNMISGDSGSIDRFGNNGAAGFTYAGNYYSTTLYSVGTNGVYWSSSVYDTDSSYNLNFSTTGVRPQNGNRKYYGNAVRCVAKDPTMQDFDASTSLPNVGDSTTLMDSRDGTTYTVKRLADGKVWMIENLTISATGMVVDSLDNTNTNIPSNDNTKYYLPPRNTRYGTANSITNSAVKTASDSVNFSSGNSNQPQVGYRAAGSTDNQTGNPVPENTAYYPYYTASLGFSYYGDSSVTSGSSPRDICPKGWHLPFVSNGGTTVTTPASSEFANLARTYNGSATWSGSGDTSYDYYTSDGTIRQNMVYGDSGSLDRFANNGAVGFTYAGYYGSTTLNNVGTVGFYWSSSVYDTSYSYRLGFTTTNVYPQNNGNKDYGFAVRCVAGS